MNTHITRDGKTMLIASMDDRHLLNTINLKLSQMEEAKKIIYSNLSGMNAIFFDGVNSKVKDEAIRFVKGYEDILSIYILEASIRKLDIESYLNRLRGLIERSESLIVPTFVNNINMIDYDEDDEYEDDYNYDFD